MLFCVLHISLKFYYKSPGKLQFKNLEFSVSLELLILSKSVQKNRVGWRSHNFTQIILKIQGRVTLH